MYFELIETISQSPRRHLKFQKCCTQDPRSSNVSASCSLLIEVFPEVGHAVFSPYYKSGAYFKGIQLHPKNIDYAPKPAAGQDTFQIAAELWTSKSTAGVWHELQPLSQNANLATLLPDRITKRLPLEGTPPLHFSKLMNLIRQKAN